jgi:hypothetical protein
MLLWDVIIKIDYLITRSPRISPNDLKFRTIFSISDFSQISSIWHDLILLKLFTSTANPPVNSQQISKEELSGNSQENYKIEIPRRTFSSLPSGNYANLIVTLCNIWLRLIVRWEVQNIILSTCCISWPLCAHIRLNGSTKQNIVWNWKHKWNFKISQWN